LKASAAAVRCAGLSSFIKFLVTAANKAEFDQADVGAAGMQLLYVNRLRLIQDVLAKSVAKFTMLAKRESVQTKQIVAMLQPEKAQQQAQAIQNYVRKGHWNAMLEELCRLCREVRRSPAKKIKSSQFRQLGFWLMAMLIYINRSRRQAASLLTNSDFAQ
jgi:hypothetical protein